MKTSTDIPKAPGIYRISIGPRTFYWGQAQDLSRRATAHFSRLKRGAHHNQQLQNSFDRHGEAAYSFEVSLLCPVGDLDMQEQLALDTYHGAPGCANVALVASTPMRGLVRPHTAQTKERLRLAHTGKRLSEEHRANLSESHKGNRQDPEHVKRLAQLRRSPVAVSWIGGDTHILPTVADAAKLVGVHYTTLSHWLAGRKPIPAKYNIDSISRTELPATINPEAI